MRPRNSGSRRFSNVIEEEIGKARCMVVLWSAVSVAKDLVVEGAEDGKSRGVLVPVFIEAVQPPRGFRRIEAADLSNWRGDTSDAAFPDPVPGYRFNTGCSGSSPCGLAPLVRNFLFSTSLEDPVLLA